MHTTTEWRAGAAAVLRFAAAAVAVVVTWFAGLGAVARWVEPAGDVLVFVAPQRVPGLLSSAPVRAIDAPAGVRRVRGDAPGYVRHLYASGATFVLPAAGAGCRGLSTAERLESSAGSPDRDPVSARP